MKKEIHPTWYNDAKVSCACGNSFVTGATVPEIKVEVCSNCHSFYTGNQKLIDTTGRVNRFESRVAKSQAIKAARTKKTAPKETQEAVTAQ